LKNAVFELVQNKQLFVVQYELLQGDYAKLIDSVNEISNAKNIEDNFKFQMDRLHALVETHNQEAVD